MKSSFFRFGEVVDGYQVPVLNEREARAAAGILFVLAMIAFMHAWLLRDFFYLQIVITLFLIDFFVRVVINPLFAPSLILGRIMTLRQKVEYTGAPQKRFAWAIGLFLAVTMFFLVVVQGYIGPVNLLICLMCLVFLFFETAFGICIGCWMYNRINKEKAQLCPGGACEIRQYAAIQSVNKTHLTAFLLGTGTALLVSWLII